MLRISENVRAYAFLILSSQASARSSIDGNTASAFTAQSAFLNNFENVVNRSVDICKDIKRYQDTLSYASSKVNYSVGESIYMLPSDMTLKIRPGTVGYNNKILVSDEKFILGKNEKVNSVPVMKSHKVTQTATRPKRNSNDVLLSHAPNISHGVAGRPWACRAHKPQEPKTITHNDQKNCVGTGSGRWFCNMEYISINITNLNK